MDARQFGFNTFVIEDATKAIDLEGSLEQAWQQMLDRAYSVSNQMIYLKSQFKMNDALKEYGRMGV